MKSLFSLAHVSQWWSLECRATPPSKNTSSRPLHRQCFWITVLCNSAPFSFLYLIIKKNMCRGKYFYILFPITCKDGYFTQNKCTLLRSSESSLRSMDTITEIEQESQMANVSFYLALKWPFGLLLSLKYNQAIATWHKLKEWSGSWLIYLENHQLSISIRAMTTQTKSNFKRMQTQPLSGPISEKTP